MCEGVTGALDGKKGVRRESERKEKSERDEVGGLWETLLQKRGKVMAYTQGKQPKNRKERVRAHTHTLKSSELNPSSRTLPPKKSRSHSVAATKSTHAGRISPLSVLCYQSLFL